MDDFMKQNKAATINEMDRKLVKLGEVFIQPELYVSAISAVVDPSELAR